MILTHTNHVEMYERWMSLGDFLHRYWFESVKPKREFELAWGSTWQVLVAMYEGREYHSLKHIQNCLRQLDQVRGKIPNPPIVEFSIWLHDAVYLPGVPKKGELASARLAKAIWRQFGGPFQHESKIVGLITDTAWDANYKFFHDIDWSILQAPPAEYHAYSVAIRAEHSHIPDREYYEHRRIFLEHSLAKGQDLYKTRHYQAGAAQAKMNMVSEIESLVQSLS